MTSGRIILLALALLLCAQLVMITVGLQYATSIYGNIQAQQAEIVASQLEQNVSAQLSDVNNLMSLLQMTDVTRYFTSYMNLRATTEATTARILLQDRFQQLKSGFGAVDSIYFIGENRNQQAVRLNGSTGSMDDIQHMRKDSLNYAKLDTVLNSFNGQFVRIDADALRKNATMSSAMLDDGERLDINTFLDDLDGHIVLIGGASNTMYVISLRTDAFAGLIGTAASEDSAYTLVGADNTALWSTTAQPELLQAARSGASTANARDGTYANTSRRISPFSLTLVCSQRSGVFENRALLTNMLVVSVLTLTIAFLLSFFYLKFVFRPFRRISRRMISRSEATNDTQLFRPIPEPSHGRFHAFSLRNKFIMLFCVALILLISADAFSYSRLLDSEIDRWMTQTAEKTGSIAAIGLENQAQTYVNVANQVATSDRYKNYILLPNGTSYINTPYDSPLVFPGINSISYFALLDANGYCTFSSIFTYNSRIFDIASTYLRDQDDPYWLLNYSDPAGRGSVALLRRVRWEGASHVSWLLIVPKDDAFSLAQTDRIRANYTLSSVQYPFYTHTMDYDYENRDSSHYEQLLNHPGWTFSVEYLFSGVSALRQAYQERFLISVFLVFLVASAFAFRISMVLTRPILQLKDTMAETSADGQTRLLEYNSSDEISGIIDSYNRMIVRLEDVTKENLRITQENAQNKIRENELLSLKTRAEFNMLQAQINPHFLHNTLTMIHMQCLRHGDADTGRTVTALGDLLRYSIAVGADTATLDQELRNAANYAMIQQARFGNSFQVHFDAPQELLGCVVLRSILQPLIENAIKHGFEGWQDGGNIHIRAQLRDRLLCLSVGDDGVGMEADTLERLREDLRQTLDQWQSFGNSIGLKNVYHRLKLRYGDALRMNIHSELMAGTTVELCFPAEYGTSALPSDPVDNGN